MVSSQARCPALARAPIRFGAKLGPETRSSPERAIRCVSRELAPLDCLMTYHRRHRPPHRWEEAEGQVFAQSRMWNDSRGSYQRRLVAHRSNQMGQGRLLQPRRRAVRQLLCLLHLREMTLTKSCRFFTELTASPLNRCLAIGSTLSVAFGRH